MPVANRAYKAVEPKKPAKKPLKGRVRDDEGYYERAVVQPAERLLDVLTGKIKATSRPPDV